MTLLLKLWDPNRFERLAWFHIGNIFLVGNSVIQMKVFVSSKASFPVEMLQATASSFQVYSATIFPLLKCCSAGRGWLLLVWSTWTITLMFFTIVSKEPSSKPSKFLPYLWPCSTSESPCFWYCPFPAGHTKYHRLNQYIYIFSDQTFPEYWQWWVQMLPQNFCPPFTRTVSHTVHHGVNTGA